MLCLHLSWEYHQQDDRIFIFLNHWERQVRIVILEVSFLLQDKTLTAYNVGYVSMTEIKVN